MIVELQPLAQPVPARVQTFHEHEGAQPVLLLGDHGGDQQRHGHARAQWQQHVDCVPKLALEVLEVARD